MEDTDGGLHPAVGGQSLDEDEGVAQSNLYINGCGVGGGGGGVREGESDRFKTWEFIRSFDVSY